MRPALFVDTATTSRYAHSLRRLMVGFASEACQPALICPPGYEAGSVLGPSVEVIPYPLFRIPLFYWRNKYILLERLAAFKPTVLHCFAPSRAGLTRKLAIELGLPYVLTFHSQPNSLCKPLVAPTHCAALIASSPPICERLKKLYRFMSDSVMQVNIGTFVDDRCACFNDPQRIPSMVLIQSLERISDFEPLLNALRHLMLDGKEFVAAIMGKGRADRRLHRRINELGLNERITVVGPMRPLRNILAGADIFLQLQPVTNAFTNVLDAMSVGMAVASCRQGAEGILTENETAQFFDPYDELTLYAALKTLLDDREKARQMAQGGQDYIRREHSVSRMVEELIAVYSMAQDWFKKSVESPEPKDISPSRTEDL